MKADSGGIAPRILKLGGGTGETTIACSMLVWTSLKKVKENMEDCDGFVP